MPAAKAANQSEDDPEIAADEDENRKITAAETLKNLDEVKISTKSTEATIST